MRSDVYDPQATNVSCSTVPRIARNVGVFAAVVTLSVTLAPLAEAKEELEQGRGDIELTSNGSGLIDNPDIGSPNAARVLQWVAASRDNGDLPYIVIDKVLGRLHLFDAGGDLLGEAPVLIGVATGDDASPGIGSKSLSEIGPAEKTTPAGRFLAKIGWAAGNEKVLWVDYATSVALHAVVTGNKRERRLQRLASPEADDNRITYGCINVPKDFYQDNVRPLFEKDGGIVYVLPDTKPLEDVFPRVRTLPYL